MEFRHLISKIDFKTDSQLFREEEKKNGSMGLNVGSTLKSTTNLKALIPSAFLHGPGAKAIMVMVIPRINSLVTHEAILAMYAIQSSFSLSVEAVSIVSVTF